MPKIKCSWDRCKHYNVDTGYCDNPDEIDLKTVVATLGSIKDKELLECSGFVDFEEGEAKK